MAKVLVLAPYVPYPAHHGGAIRSQVLLDALRVDHEVHLAAAVAGPADGERLAALSTSTGVTGHELPAIAEPRPRRFAKVARWLVGSSELIVRRWQPGAASRAAAISSAVRPDLTIADSTFALPVAGLRAALYLHNLESAMLARPEGPGRSLGERLTRRCEARGLRNWERAALRRAPWSVVVSAADRELAAALAPAARIEVVPNSVDVERLPLLPPAAPQAAPRLLFVGSLDYPPNLAAVRELVADHLPGLRAAFPGLVVRVVGKDPQAAGRAFAGVPGVEHVGAVDDVVPHYRDVHAVYLPIRSGGGTRIKILEAWALGVPVLATAIGCEGLPGADGELVRRFETPAEGIAALRAVLAGGGATMRTAARARVVAEFSHRAAIARLRQVVASGFAAAGVSPRAGR